MVNLLMDLAKPFDTRRISSTNVEHIGDCSVTLVSGNSCSNTGHPGFLCEASTCGNGVLTPDICLEQGFMANSKIRSAVTDWVTHCPDAINGYGHIRDTNNVIDMNEF